MADRESELQQSLNIALDPPSKGELEGCLNCEGNGEVEYLRTGHTYPCNWCQGNGRVTPEVNEAFVNSVVAIHGIWGQLWLGL